MKLLKKTAVFLLIFALTNALFTACSPGKENEEERIKMYNNPYRIYMSLSGDDSNSGLIKSEPVKSFAAAIDKASKVSQESADGYDAIVITIEEGRYAIDETIEINKTINSCPVIFEGEGTVKISGGEIYKGGWQKEGNIYKLYVGEKEFRQLYINSVPGIRARYPNHTGDPYGDDTVFVTWDEENRKIGIQKYLQDELPEDLTGIEFNIVQDWTYAIAAITETETTDDYLYLTLQSDIRKSMFDKPYYAPGRRTGQRAWFENHKEFLDGEGEWYYDRVSGYLYYMPAAETDINLLEFEIPCIETLLHIRGTKKNTVKNISFSNIIFEATNWALPLQGYLDLQANQYLINGSSSNFKHPPSAILCTFANNVGFYDCTIRNTGSTAVDFGIGAVNCWIKASAVYNAAGNGISLGYFGEPTMDTINSSFSGYVPNDMSDVNSGTLIENCIIKNIGMSLKGGTGILGGYIKNLTVKNCEIYNVSYSGMGLGWGWNAQDSIMSGFIIQNNKIYDCMNYLTCDGAEIYTLGRHDPDGKMSVIEGNYIESNGHEYGSLYFDNSSSHYIVRNNVFKGSGYRENQGTNYGMVVFFFNSYDYDITFTNNYGTVKGYMLYLREENDVFEAVLRDQKLSVEEPIIAFEEGKWNSDAQKIIDDSGIRKAYESVRDK